MKVTPLRNGIFFQFEDPMISIGGKRVFQERSAGGILFNNFDQSLNQSRWGIVTHVGPDVTDGVKVGSRICVHHGKWTAAFKIDGNEYYWKTDSEHVIMIDDNVAA